MLLTQSLFGNVFTSTIEYAAPAVPVEAKEIEILVEPPEPLEEMADRIADRYGVSRKLLHNLVYSESRWNPDADNGADRGLVQINRKAWPEVTDKQAFDPEFALSFAAEKISEGEEYLWTPCSCVSTARLKNKHLPRGNARDLNINTLTPKVGDIVKFRFGNVYHVAYIEDIRGMEMDIFQGNKEPCLVTRETVRFDHPDIIGYWSATPTPTTLKTTTPTTTRIILYSKTEYLQ